MWQTDALVESNAALTIYFRERGLPNSCRVERTAGVRNSPLRIRDVTDQPIPSLLSSGKVKPVIYSTVYPLASAMDGLGALERRETWGKAVVRVRDEEHKTTARL